jgi:hypothetical protein
MYHTAEVYGGYMIAFGGFNGEEKMFLDEFDIFDLGKIVRSLHCRMQLLGEALNHQAESES